LRIRIRRGLDVPVSGAPRQELGEVRPVSSVALLGEDYRGFRPRLLVGEGQHVDLGQPLLEDARLPELRLTAPGTGVVEQVLRGERRALHAVVVRLDEGDETSAPFFDPLPRESLPALERDVVAAQLLESGLWSALRERPFDRLARPGTEPRSLFVTAIDTNPLAPDPAVVVAAEREAFADGLDVVSRLTSGHVFLCRRAGAALPAGRAGNVVVVDLSGPHPAGLVGTHVDRLDPVDRDGVVWHLGYQDVVAVGHLFRAGRLSVARTVSLAGPVVLRPRLVTTRLGACTDELLAGELQEGPARLVAGSLLAGRQASGWGRWLGRYDVSVAALPEPRRGAPRRGATTALNGRPTAFVPSEAFERVVPLDVLPAPLLRALVVGDLDAARALGARGLVEEDLALCTYVCPGKQEYGPPLRRVLERMERES
jgi:Na+-transporting NADH:ubiquinone oxidoreductase subunit A